MPSRAVLEHLDHAAVLVRALIEAGVVQVATCWPEERSVQAGAGRAIRLRCVVTPGSSRPHCSRPPIPSSAVSSHGPRSSTGPPDRSSRGSCVSWPCSCR